MNPFSELLRKLETKEALTRSESARLGQIDASKLPIYAQAYDELSTVFPTRTARREARDRYAELLNVTPRTINLVVAPDFHRPERIREIHSHYVTTAERQLALLKAALNVIAENADPDKEAEQADCSSRTVYRKVQMLLDKSSLVLSDLKTMPFELRRGIAQEIRATMLPDLEKTLEKRRENAQKDKEIRKKQP